MLTALLVPVPEAEPVVAAHRARLDPSAAWGVPAHVTVLYPFLPLAALDDGAMARAAAAIASVPRFEATFARTRWFGTDVLWLEPEPAGAFGDLITAVTTAFRECPPYEGTIDDPVAHLTVGDRAGGVDVDDLVLAERAVVRSLPIAAGIATVSLMTGRREPGSWSVRHEFALG